MRHPAPRCRTAIASPLAFALVALAACGNAPAPEEDADTPAATPAADVADGPNPHIASDICALIPVADVAAAVDGTEPLRAEAGQYPPASCRYFFDVPEGTGQQSMSATVQMLDSYSLERTGAGDAAIDVSGIGDEAWARDHTDTYLLYARRGPLVFSVNVAGGTSDAWPDMARSIASVVLDRL